MKTIFTSSIILLLLTLVLGCRKRPEKTTGEIKVLSGIYPSVSKGLESGRTFHVSTLSFSPKGLIESALEPDGSRQWHHLGKEGYWTLLLVGGIKGETPTAPLSYRTKQSGAPFLKGLPPGYARREELSDTLLFKKRYRRFEIRTPHSLTRYYIFKTDTLCPYEVYPGVYGKYKGRLERIDSYDKKRDVFTTFQLLHSATVSSEGSHVLSLLKPRL